MENQSSSMTSLSEAPPVPARHTHRDHSADNPVAQAGQPKVDRSQIQGWGADLDHANRPAYPMARMPARLDHPPSGPTPDQPLNMEVFHSIERPGVTPLFGTSAPPKGVSGKIRRFAYKLSESDIRHWLLLLLADRVNVVEGIGEDLMRGRVPNILAEMGAGAELRHNPAGFARKAAVATAVVGVGYYLLRRRKRHQD